MYVRNLYRNCPIFIVSLALCLLFFRLSRRELFKKIYRELNMLTAEHSAFTIPLGGRERGVEDCL